MPAARPPGRGRARRRASRRRGSSPAAGAELVVGGDTTRPVAEGHRAGEKAGERVRNPDRGGEPRRLHAPRAAAEVAPLGVVVATTELPKVSGELRRYQRGECRGEGIATGEREGHRLGPGMQLRHSADRPARPRRRAPSTNRLPGSESHRQTKSRQQAATAIAMPTPGDTAGRPGQFPCSARSHGRLGEEQGDAGLDAANQDRREALREPVGEAGGRKHRHRGGHQQRAGGERFGRQVQGDRRRREGLQRLHRDRHPEVERGAGVDQPGDRRTRRSR